MADAGVPVEEHLERILGLVSPLAPTPVALGAALGLVCAEDATAETALPRFDHAAMDGYAVRAADVAGASPQTQVSLPVTGSIAAGGAWAGALAPGTALRIMTGAAVPDGADLVVPFEWTDGGDPVRVHRAAGAGRHVRRAGEDLAQGSVAVPAGTVLTPGRLGLLAAVGRPVVVVRPRARVAVVSTGAELVPAVTPAERMAADAVTDSNSVALAAACRAMGAEVATYGPVPDDPARLGEQLVAAADDADLVLTTGGISAGDHDVVRAALGGEPGFWFGPVAVKPGRPQGFGVLADTNRRKVPMIAFPGTPVAAHTSFCLFGRAAIERLAGRPRTVRTALLATSARLSVDRTVVLPGRLDDAGRVAVVPGHAGHSQRNLAAADALVVLPPGPDDLPAGARVAVLPLGWPD